MHIHIFTFPDGILFHVKFLRGHPAEIVCHFQNHIGTFQIGFPLIPNGLVSHQRTQNIAGDCTGGVTVAAVVDGGNDAGRKVYVSLTEKGRNAVTDIRETMVESASVVFDDMDEEKRALFYTKVKELQELFNTGGWKE